MSDGVLVNVTRLGRPRTKGSLKVFCVKNARHTVRVEEETKDSSLWRAQVAKAAQVDMLARHGRLLNFDGPVTVSLTFWFEKQISVAKRGGGQVIPSHDTEYPTDIMLGDLDKLTRNALDALVDAHVIADDSQVYQLAVMKLWGIEAGVDCVVRGRL